MKREMKHNIRISDQFKEDMLRVYKKTKSCHRVAVFLTLKYEFSVSAEYVGRILKTQGVTLQHFGNRQYTIYDTQLGRN